MFRIAVVGTILSGLLATTSRADIPLPPNLKYIKPELRIEGTDKYPEYAFRLRYRSYVSAPMGFFQFRSFTEGKPFTLDVQRRLEVQLLALKPDQLKQLEKKQTPEELINEPQTIPDVLSVRLPVATTGPAAADKPTPVQSFRVSIQDGKLVVTEIVDEPKKSGVASPWSMWISGLALSLGIAGLGLWLSRNVNWSRSRQTVNPAV